MRLSRHKQAPPPTGRQRRSTDWQAPAAFSYHAQRSERTTTNSRQQPNAVQQRSHILSLRYWSRRSGLLIAVVVVLICAISVVSLSNTPRIVLLSKSGTALTGFQNQTIYQQAASRDLSSSIWNRNKITANTAALSSKLQQQFPELGSVNVTLPLVGHRPIIYLQANAPSFVFHAVNGTYVLDSSGTAMTAQAAAPANSTAHLPVLTDQTGLHVQLGQRVISANNANFIQTVVANLKAKQVGIASLDLPAGAAQELDVHLSGQAYYIKFNMHDSSGAQQQAGTYLATLQNLQSQHITPAQYIDVRVPGRAYYQ